jgi:hypothetical protein
MSRTRLWLALSFVAVAGIALAHPHVVRQITLPLQKGELKVKYFTVPYDAKALEGLPVGLFWHLGFAGLDVKDEALTAGQTSIPAGSYHLFARAEKDNKWSLVIVPQGPGQAIAMSAYQIINTKDEAKRQELLKKAEEMAKGMIVLPTEFTKGGEKGEHLRIGVEDLGLNFGERQGGAAPDKPLGRDLLLRVDFGELHGTVALSEPMGDASATKESGGK